MAVRVCGEQDRYISQNSKGNCPLKTFLKSLSRCLKNLFHSDWRQQSFAIPFQCIAVLSHNLWTIPNTQTISCDFIIS